MSQEAALVDRAARTLGDYIQTGRTRKDLLKEVAALLVDLRTLHTLEDGRMDLGGRSSAYRENVAEIYRRAHVPRDKYDTVQAALRYHVGNLLRDRFDESDLAAVGLNTVSPKARLARQREVVAAMSRSGSVGELVSDPLRLITYAEALLEHVYPERLEALTPGERAAARLALDAVEARARSLKPAVAARRKARGKAV